MTIPRAITPTELAYLRRDNQWSELFLHVDAPATVYTARLNGAPASTNKVVEITYDGGSGTLGNVLPGMTLAVGSAAGASEKGLCRIRAVPGAAKFYLGETSEIAWADNDYLTVLDEFGLWPRHVGQVGLDTYVDYNIAYSNQHANLAPVVVGGPNPVVWLTGPTVAVAFDASESWVLGGGAITYSWTASGASATSGLTTSTPTLTYNAADRYRVSCAATANGKTTTRYWHVQVYDAAHPPLTQFAPGQITSGDDGYTFTVTMYAEADTATIRDRARVTLFARDHYGDTEISLGQMAGRENLVAWGWIAGETIEWSAELSTVTFEVRPPGYWLQQIAGFPAGFENVSGAATKWDKFHNLTVDKGLWSTLYFRSTAPLCLDFSLTGDTKRVPDMAAPGSISLWEQINTLAYQAILAKPKVDRLGRLWVEVDAQYLPAASRAGLTTVMTLTAADWRDKLTIQRNPTNRCSLVDLSGIAYDGATGTTLFALASGEVYLTHGQPTRLDRLILASQAQANELAGLVMGQANNLYPSIPTQLAANNRLLDTAPNQFVSLKVAAGDTPRGVAFTLNLLPRRITYQWDAQSGALWPSVEFEGETFAALAVTGIGPETFPDPPASDPPVVETPGGDDTPPDLVYVMLGGGLYRSRDFSSAAPTWTQVGVELAFAQSDFVLDLYTPKNTAYISGLSGVWSSANLDSYANFANSLTAPQFTAATGDVLYSIQAVRATITYSGRLYCLAIGQTGLVYTAYVGRSSDNGATWAWTALGATTNGTDLHGLACSQVNADTVYASAGAGTLYKSTNGGVSFSSTSPVGLQSKPIANIDVPYVLGDDSLVLIGGPGTAVASEFSHYFLNNAPPSEWVNEFGVWIQTASLPSAGYAMWSHPSLPASGTMTVVWSLNDPVYYPGWDVPGYNGTISFRVFHDNNYAHISGATGAYHGPDCNGAIRTDTFAYSGGATDVGIGCIQISSFSATIYSVSVDGITYYSASADDYIMKSTDSGASFADITPASGGAIGWRGLHSDATDSNHLTALVGSDPASLDLVISTDGTTWSDPPVQMGLSAPVALGRWPYGSNQGFLLTADKVYWTADDFATLVDKTGDLAVSDPRMIVPMWVAL